MNGHTHHLNAFWNWHKKIKNRKYVKYLHCVIICDLVFILYFPYTSRTFFFLSVGFHSTFFIYVKNIFNACLPFFKYIINIFLKYLFMYIVLIHIVHSWCTSKILLYTSLTFSVYMNNNFQIYVLNVYFSYTSYTFHIRQEFFNTCLIFLIYY